MAETTASGRSLRAATSAAKALPAEVLPDAAKSETCDGPSQRSDGDNDHRAEESLGELIHTETLQVDGVAECCYWCHEPLPPLPDDASYVDEINHYIHDECREERDESNRNREILLTGIAEGRVDSIPEKVRDAVLDRIRRLGFSRRCPCLYDEAYGFRGYDVHSFDADDEDDFDARNSVEGCEMCGGSGNYDPLRQLLELTDDKAAAAWVEQELPKSAGPCDLWGGFPEEGWHYEALGYHRKGKGAVRGVTLYNLDQLIGGVITWLEIAELFRPRSQSKLF